MAFNGVFTLVFLLSFMGTMVATTESGGDQYISLKELRELVHRIPLNPTDDWLDDGDDEEEPLQLLKPTQGHAKLELNEMVVERLSAIDEPVSFVSVVGPYHGGKSFLLNVLLNSTHGFNVGSTAEPETRGIWIRVIPKSKLKGVDGSQVILLDTEGFYGEGATRLYDAKVFAIATLLSSHLVYNTLRTLGDAHSVSSLADLSKHAQIFNLENWLHTADLEDGGSLSVDMDTSLLLKTLDFPPLTWVVQGFDLDLQASEKPIDFLRRYITAQAQTGDYTLDSLFSHGISCYTLRTPADLNDLREKYGGKGLAAEKDLFNNLHPKYRKDVESLRLAVFGNLTAKGSGNLTAKKVASLLPLLVHYVNENFPLQAERKLRDVLVDIIVDGAFSGGVQYFEKEMKTTSSRSERLDLSKNVFSSSLHDLDILAKLAMSAYTSEEINRILEATEKKAVDYCHRRCVGVTPVRTKQVCEASLSVKLDRMKPFYRDQNNIHVRQILVRLGEVLCQKADLILFEIKLPVPEVEVQSNCSIVVKDAFERYEALVGPHKGSALYEEACKRMHEQISMKCDQVAKINVDKIQSILNIGKGEYQIAYNDAFSAFVKTYVNENKETRSDDLSVVNQRLKKPVTNKVLAKAYASTLNIAQQAFDRAVRNGGLSWIGSGNQLYDFQQFQCIQWSKQRFKEIEVQNHADIVTFSRSLVSDVTGYYGKELSDIKPFPDNDEIVSGKAEHISKQLFGIYVSMTKDYGIPEVEEKGKELLQNIGTAKEHLIKKNTVLMAAYCYDPLMNAYKELRMEECERSFHNLFVSCSIWSLKCLWPGPYYTHGFKYVAYTIARKNLEKAHSSATRNSDITNGKNDFVLSPVTQNKVIQAWIDNDLARHANVVYVNFSCLVALIVVITTFILFKRKDTIDPPYRPYGHWS